MILKNLMHYSIEHKLLSLVKSLQQKQKDNTWNEQLHEPEEPYNP